MVKEHSANDGEANDQRNNEQERVSNKGCSRYARVAESESISAWLERKDKKQSEQIAKRNSGRKGLNRVSKKQKIKNKLYKEAREVHYADEDNRQCFLCGTHDNLSVHHKIKRGTKIDDAFYFVTLCILGTAMDERYADSNHSHSGGCHGWLHANAKLAKELGLIL